MPYNQMQTPAPPVPPMQGGMGLPPEYGDQLFNNLQQKARMQQKASRQQIIDNTSRFPGQSGVQQGLLQQVGQQGADQALSLNQDAQLQGVQANLQDRRQQQQYAFQGQQNDLQRKLQEMMQGRQLGQEQNQFDQQKQWQILNSILSAAGSGVGAFAALA